MSWLFAVIEKLLSPFAFGELITDPFILEIFISNKKHIDAPIGFKVNNTTKHSLKTDIAITPVVHNELFSTIKYYEVLNPGGEYVVERIEGDYKYIRHINAEYGLNYKNNRQPLKFKLRARFRNSRLKVLKTRNYTEIVCAYKPENKSFSRIK